MPSFIVSLSDEAAADLAEYAKLYKMPLEAALKEVVETWSKRFRARGRKKR